MDSVGLVWRLRFVVILAVFSRGVAEGWLKSLAELFVVFVRAVGGVGLRGCRGVRVRGWLRSLAEAWLVCGVVSWLSCLLATGCGCRAWWWHLVAEVRLRC
ncbi:hypothetical protein Droror1_Dr00020279 [Drosera rotundifolia]